MHDDDRYEIAGMPEHAPAALLTEPSPSLLPAVLAGLVAAVAGAVVWGFVTKTTDYEVGIVAWALGFVVGTAVVLASRGGKGTRLQVTAVVFALLGILLGKYLGYALTLQDEAERFGESVGLFSARMRSFFQEDVDVVFGAFDLLWVGLALFTAWRIPQPDGPETDPAG